MAVPVPPALMADTAKHFGTDPALLAAMVTAEGGTDHTTIRAVQCSLPEITALPDALNVFCRSANHAAFDFLKSQPGLAAQFVAFFAHRWAPVGVDNDPTALNANWPTNVLQHWPPR